jgi:alkaline phosphatase D
MSNLRAPGLGPIIGHTSSTSATIWIRGYDPDDGGSNIHRHRRTIGVIAIVAVNGKVVSKPQVHYFRMQREYDRTGIFTLGHHTGLGESKVSPALKPDTQYDVRVGTLTIDDPNPDDESMDDDTLAGRLPSPAVWASEIKGLSADQAGAALRTFPDSTDQGPVDSIGFVLGSCRYPGLLWQVRHADEIFKPLLKNTAGEADHAKAQFVMMVGDQIYADTLNRHIPIGLADTFEEFQERYHNAFGSRNMRKLLRSVPTYMILDDHEIEDNWAQDRANPGEGLKSSSSKRKVFNWAMYTYRSYQWIHSPRNFGERLFYTFDCGGYPFFILDMRTQRFMEDVEASLDDNHLLGRPSLAGEEPSQLDFLLDWLSAQQKIFGNVPKFIGASSVFAPNPISARELRQGSDAQQARWKEASDSWPAFPQTRRALLRHIVENEIRNVVFLSGDIHCSNIATLTYSGANVPVDFKTHSITSSAFYWPFSFADGDPSGFVHDSTLAGQEDTFDLKNGIKMDYTATNFTQEDNFCRIDVNREKSLITVYPYDKRGDLIEKGGWFDTNKQKLISEIQLNKW